MLRRIVSGAAAAACALSVCLTSAGSASASGWSAADLTAITKGPKSIGAPIAYVTNLPGQGPAARVVHLTDDGVGDKWIEELSLDTAGWHANNLTALLDAPASSPSAPSGYSTNQPGQGPVGRLVFRTWDDEVQELSLDGSGWHQADLTTITGAPQAASGPSTYTTNSWSQGPIARVVYLTRTGAVEELSLDAWGWHAADLTAITGAPSSVSAPLGYGAAFGAFARVVYLTATGHVEQLSLDINGWSALDLSALTGAPAGVSAPFGYGTAQLGTGAFVRVVYQTGAGHVEELSQELGQTWKATDLTALTGAPSGGWPKAYVTSLTGQGPVARVVYQTNGNHIEELSTDGAAWHANDLTAISGGPKSVSAPFGYTTNQAGQGPVARVVYMTDAGHIEELSVS